jgi:hypothetical protein
MFRNSIFIGGPTWIWNPNSPFIARPLASSSTSMAVTWPLIMLTMVLARAMRWT